MFTQRVALPVVAASLLALAGCQPSAPAPEGQVKVFPAVAQVDPGGQVQFTVTSPWGTDVTWSVNPPVAGTITPGGLFTASTNAGQGSGICTVSATLRSDPSKVGLSVVMVQVEPPVNAVVAAGRQQSAEGLQVESVALEPITSVTSKDAAGTVENRSGFYPSGNVSP